jgi:hypothetical protein
MLRLVAYMKMLRSVRFESATCTWAKTIDFYLLTARPTASTALVESINSNTWLRGKILFHVRTIIFPFLESLLNIWHALTCSPSKAIDLLYQSCGA